MVFVPSPSDKFAHGNFKRRAVTLARERSSSSAPLSTARLASLRAGYPTVATEVSIHQSAKFTARVWLACSLLPTTLFAQWEDSELYGEATAVHDTQRGRTFLFDRQRGYMWDYANGAFQIVARGGPIVPNPTLTFDPIRGECVLFDPSNGETWTFNGADWRLAATTGPSPRGSTTMAFSPASGRVTLHGEGLVFGNGLRDTWEWNGTSWMRVATGPAATNEANGGMAQTRNNELVLISRDGLFAPIETWLWNGSAWRQHPAAPPSMYIQSLEYDPVCDVTVAHGSDLALIATTYTFDGTSWTQVSTHAEAAFPTASAFDSVSGGMLYFKFRRVFELSNGTWTIRSERPFAAPERAQIEFDSARNTMVLVEHLEFKTWDHGPSGWNSVQQGSAADSRFGSMAFDAARGEMVWFGGEDANGLQNNSTWTRTSGPWMQRANTGPSPRVFAAMVFDEARQQTVLFGGRSGTSAQSDTWTWDGVSWTLRAPQLSPPARDSHEMAYDVDRQRVVLYGGTRSGPTQVDADVWEWDGTNWSRIQAVGPGPRWNQGMAYDRLRRRVVMHSGQPIDPPQLDTWEWDGRVWTNSPVANAEFPLAWARLVYDPRSQRLTHIGAGLPRFTLEGGILGSGCPGLSATPQLRVDTDRPELGGAFTNTGTNVPASSSVLIITGFEPTQSSAPLGSLGLTGCNLHVLPVVTDLVPAVTGTVAQTLTIPNDLSLVGLRLVTQLAMTAPGANRANAILSNATVVVVSP